MPRRSKTPDAVMALHVRQAFDDAIKKTCSDLPEKVLFDVHAKVFKNRTLTVGAPRLVAAELSMRSGGILHEVNAILGRKVVTRLSFRGN